MNLPRDKLDDWLAVARAELAQIEPPAWVEASVVSRQAEAVLLKRLREHPPAAVKAPSRRWRFIGWGLPATAAALLALGAAMLLARTPPAQVPVSAAFVALTPLETIAAERSPLVIASEVPRSQLASLGVPVDPARADLLVRAEFLVSRRGAVLAVRFSPE